jgi:type I restriction enzyme M protein
MVALPPQLFFNTQIPACLWFLNRAKPAERQGQVLFIDARSMGRMVDRTRRELTAAEIERIAGTYHNWRVGQFAKLSYQDEPGFCKSATLEDIAAHDFVLTPGRYVGASDVVDDGEPFEEKMERLAGELRIQISEGNRLDKMIEIKLEELGFDD